MQVEKRVVERRCFTLEERHKRARQSEETASGALPGLIAPVNDALGE